MYLVISREWLELLSEDQLKTLSVTKDSTKSTLRDVKLNLVRLTEEQIDCVHEFLVTGVRSCKESREAVGVVKRWRDILQGKEPRATNAKSAADLLSYFIASETSDLRLYQNIGGQWYAYLVERVDYNPEQKGRDYTPASVDVELRSVLHGSVKKKVVSYETSACAGRTAKQLLASKMLYVGTPEIVDSYERSVEDYSNIVNCIGARCEFSGIGFQDDNSWRHSERDDLSDVGVNKDQFLASISGKPTTVVVDVIDDSESSSDVSSLDQNVLQCYELSMAISDLGRSPVAKFDYIEPEQDERGGFEVPVHPLVPVFDLIRHNRYCVNAADLKAHVYDTTLVEKLILPEEQKRLLSILASSSGNEFNDIIGGKSGGTVVLLAGKPGLGKTLSAEVFSESSGRPLYRVQCSQLGIDPDTIEKHLARVFLRSRRWNAVVLLDEADLYVGERGLDLNRNAIVCVFLRVLESQDGVLFLTTNMPETVDDAISSRCIARIDVVHPIPTSLRSIWDVLLSSSGVTMSSQDIDYFVKTFPMMGGRDVKGAIKLAMVHSGGGQISISRDRMLFILSFHPSRGSWLK